jgi:hypothetical protein
MTRFWVRYGHDQNTLSWFSKYLAIFCCSLLTQGLAGIQAIDVPGVENVSMLMIILALLLAFHLSYFALHDFCTFYRSMLPSLLMAILHTCQLRNRYWNILK